MSHLGLEAMRRILGGEGGPQECGPGGGPPEDLKVWKRMS